MSQDKSLSGLSYFDKRENKKTVDNTRDTW